MDILFALRFSDEKYSFRVAKNLLRDFEAEVKSAGIDDGNRKPDSHKGAAIEVWINSEPSQKLQSWTESFTIESSPKIHAHEKPNKPRGENLVEYYFRFPYDILSPSDNKFELFILMLEQCLKILQLRWGINFSCLEQDDFFDKFIKKIEKNREKYYDESDFGSGFHIISN